MTHTERLKTTGAIQNALNRLAGHATSRDELKAITAARKAAARIRAEINRQATEAAQQSLFRDS